MSTAPSPRRDITRPMSGRELEEWFKQSHEVTREQIDEALRAVDAIYTPPAPHRGSGLRYK